MRQLGNNRTTIIGNISRDNIAALNQPPPASFDENAAAAPSTQQMAFGIADRKVIRPN